MDDFEKIKREALESVETVQSRPSREKSDEFLETLNIQKTTPTNKLIGCPHCNSQISIDAANCPQCGAQIRKTSTYTIGNRAIVIGLACGIFYAFIAPIHYSWFPGVEALSVMLTMILVNFTIAFVLATGLAGLLMLVFRK